MKAQPSTLPLAPVTLWRDEITLVPWSGLQMLDFGFRPSDLVLKTQRFIERVTGRIAGPEGDLAEHVLIPLTGDDSLDAEALRDAGAEDDEYSLSIAAALEPFLGHWVPVLRLKTARGPGGEELYDPGPSAWAQLRVVRLETPRPVSGHTHRVQLAPDTALGVGADRLDALFMTLKRAERQGRRLTHDMLPHRLEHWARYLAFLKVLTQAIRFSLIRLCNTVGQNDAIRPVEVDLVLDIGTSRT